MLHTVEVSSFRGDIIAAMTNMMTWLNSRGSQPIILQEAAGNGTAFHLRFSSEREGRVAIFRSMPLPDLGPEEYAEIVRLVRAAIRYRCRARCRGSSMPS